MRIYRLLLIQVLLISITICGEITIGADVVSRYVWRGSDYGNAAAVQPTIESKVGPLTIGAWGSWSISPGPEDASGNECDVYATTSIGPVDFTLTDYFFPTYFGADSLFNLDKHIFELGFSTDVGPVSLYTANNVSGDDDNSIYLELNYNMLTVGLGNGSYTIDGEFAPINIGVSATRDKFFASYIINPNKETSFLVFGINF